MWSRFVLLKVGIKYEFGELMRIIIGITGSSGIIYGEKLLEFCDEKNIETDLVLSPTAKKIIEFEIDKETKDLKELASETHEYENLGAPISSGSKEVDGMIICPSSMKTIGAIANGVTDNLITRSADVTLKENRKLVLVPRETPIHGIHLENMKKLDNSGAVIIPASPGFYHNPKSIEELADFIVGKIINQFGVDHELYESWDGLK